jgi:YbbR domain-containing protein
VTKINIPMALMSLVVAVLMWANIYNFSKNPTKTDTITLPLSPVEIDETKYVISEIPSEVSVTVAGTRDQLSKVTSQSPSAIVDMRSAGVGTKNYPVVVFPPSMRDLLVSSNPTARVRVDQLASKEMTIAVKRIGASAATDSFETDTFPRTVYVNGPADLVRRIANVQVSTEFSGSATSSAGVEIQPLAVDSEGKVIQKILFTASNSKPAYNEEKLDDQFLVRVRVKPKPLVGLP